jgi:hypothetical protein
MFDNKLTQEHIDHINQLVKLHVNKAKRSSSETAWQDCERNGMDAIRRYCNNNNLPTLGDHMIHANISLTGVWENL